MIGLVLCGICFVSVYWATRRNLGLGVALVLAIGYSYGLVRARFPDGGTHFTFDSGAIALYLAHFTGTQDADRTSRSRFVQPWAMALAAWPVICMMVAAAIPETQPILVQLVGLRAAAMYVPFIVLGARLRKHDLDQIALALAILNVLALALGLYEFAFGVEAVMPRNRMTDLIYASKDVIAEGESHYRIPGPFQNAHMFGGVMACSIPFVVHNLENPGRLRVMAWVGVGAAAISVFLCGARTPVVVLGATTAYVLVTLRARWGTLLAVALCAGAVAYVVTHVGRFQRFETLADTDMVEGRVAQSVNVSLFDAMGEYPLGAGLASAFGTSVPFFLQDIARPPIGIESEFGRILVEQGIIGLALWVAFIALSVSRKAAIRETSGVALTFGYATIAFTWLTTGLLGAGLLAAIPEASFLFLLSGMRLALVPVVAPELSVRQVGVRSAPKLRTAGLATARRALNAPISRTSSPS
ncbi:MAG TPA: hypothetical protein VGI39_20755 [Polyangiaceae bacterium]|jgi:hypothetical protein